MINQIPSISRPGFSLITHHSFEKEASNTLYVFLLTSMLFVYGIGNLLLLSSPALFSSSKIFLVSVCCVTILYASHKASKSIIAATAILYLLLSIPVFARNPAIYGLFWILFLVSAVYIINNTKLLADFGVLRQHLCIPLVSSIAILGSQRLTTFDLLQRTAAGEVTKDTLFHASIAAMLKHYGVVSTGLHGLVETPYHAFSHGLFASISSLASVPVLDAYGSSAQILFIPLLIFYLCILAQELDSDVQISPAFDWFATSFILVLFPAILSHWCFWDSYFISESYLVSLGLFALMLIPLYRLAIPSGYFICLPILVYMMTASKASVGSVYLLLWAARVVFLRPSSLFKNLVLVAIISVAAFLGLAASAGANSEFVGFGPLHFIRTYSFWGSSITLLAKSLIDGGIPATSVFIKACIAIASFLMMHYLACWIVLARESFAVRPRFLLFAPASLYVSTSLAAGLFFGLLFEIPGGSAYFFTNISFFVCVPFLVFYTKEGLSLAVSWKSRFRLAAIVVTLAISAPGLAKASIASSIHRHDAVSSSFINSLVQIRNQSDVSVILSASSQSLKLNPVKQCNARPFIFPAVSERPWLQVAPSIPECFYQYYGYAQYGITAAEQSPSVPPIIPTGSVVSKWNVVD